VESFNAFTIQKSGEIVRSATLCTVKMASLKRGFLSQNF